MSDYFADRLGNITVAGGVVRLDFLRLTALDPENQKAELHPSFRLAMPLDGMIQAIEMLDNMRDTLLKQLEEKQKSGAGSAKAI